MAATPSTRPAPSRRRMVLYAVADLVGVAVLAGGVLWLQRGISVFGNAPHTRVEAWTMVLCGAGLTFWSGVGLLRARSGPQREDG